MEKPRQRANLESRDGDPERLERAGQIKGWKERVRRK